MNKDIIEACKQLRGLIDDLPEVKEYKRLSEMINTDENLLELKKNITLLAKKKKIEEKDNLLQVYNQNPIVQNYNNIKEEVISLLKEIQEALK